MEEAAKVVWQALNESKVKILPEECQDQTVPDRPKRSLFNIAAFKETEQRSPVWKIGLLSLARAVQQLEPPNDTGNVAMHLH